MIQASCIREKLPNPTETPSLTPAVSEYQTPTSSQELIDHQTVDRLEQEKSVIYSEIMNKMKASVDRQEQRYFVEFSEGGSEYKDNKRILLLKQPILDKSGVATWILITRVGPKSFRMEDSRDINNMEKSLRDFKHRPDGSYDNDNVWYHMGVNTTKFLLYGNTLNPKTFRFDSSEPTSDMIIEAIELSRTTKLNDAKSLYGALESLNAQQPSSSPTQ